MASIIGQYFSPVEVQTKKKRHITGYVNPLLKLQKTLVENEGVLALDITTPISSNSSDSPKGNIKWS